MRKPSIHILEEDLIALLKEDLGPYLKIDEGGLNRLMKKAAKKAITTRQVVVSNDKVMREAKKVTASRADHTLTFLSFVKLHRRKNERFVKFTIPKPGSSDFKAAKEAAADALNFCDVFELPLKEGMSRYVELGLKKMTKFAYFKFANMYEAICRDYEALREFERINQPKKSEEIKDEYLKQVYNLTGIALTNTSQEDMLNFARVADYCVKKKIPVSVYVASQFDEFIQRNSYPYPSQLYGDKALARFSRYLKSKNLRLNK